MLRRRTALGRTTLAVALALGGAAVPARAQCPAQTLTALDGASGDQFGDAVAVSGDLAVVGASRHDHLGSGSGAAYVFRYALDGVSRTWRWLEETRLTAPDGAASDLFGLSVALDAEAAGGPVVVIGAVGDDHEGGGNAGSAYVFRGEPEGEGWRWVFEEKLTAPDAAAGDEFGRAVAVGGSVIAVGAPRDDAGDTDTGSLHVFRDNGVRWMHEAGPLVAADTVLLDRLGSAVALSGDAILVGAELHDHAGISAGAAYVFRDTGSAWSEEAKLVADDASAADKFGHAVALDGDIALVGAHLDDDVASNTGSAYLFRYDGAWSEPVKLAAPAPAMDDQFGRAVAVLDGPGIDDLAVVGAPLAAGPPLGSGAAFAFRYDGVDWVGQDPLLAPDAEAGDEIGTAVALDERFVLAGANRTGATGAVRVFTTGLEPGEDCNDNGEPDFCDVASGTSEDCDGNGVPDECDILEKGRDENGNGILDECEDCNDNGVPDPWDIEFGTSLDCNGNGIPDECDLDPDDPDGDGMVSGDCDENGIPDECDIAEGRAEDCNGNGVPDACDIAEGTSEDADGDGVPDECFDDCNGNGIPDADDIADGTSLDCNENGIPDECDVDPDDPDGDGMVSGDCDENGVPDECEDCNDNGRADACDIADGTSQDLNGDGIPDECQDCDDNGIPDFIEFALDPTLDCNDNEVLDVCEIPVASGGLCTEDCDPDCDGNGVPDACDVDPEDPDGDGAVSEDCDENGVPDVCDPDCNENDVPDACDIAEGTSEDANGNGIPDECEDCNDNGVPDDQDIAEGTSEDCDGDGVPDECRLPEGSGGLCTEDCDPDCNGNGLLDACDIAEGRSADFNGNGVPDECEPDCDDDGLPDFLEILYGLEEDCQPNEIPDTCDLDPSDPDGDGRVSRDDDGDGVPDECSCPADITLDGVVDVADLVALLSSWGPCPGCPEDIDRSGAVDVRDLVTVLSAWGPC